MVNLAMSTLRHMKAMPRMIAHNSTDVRSHRRIAIHWPWARLVKACRLAWTRVSIPLCSGGSVRDVQHDQVRTRWLRNDRHRYL